MIGLLFEVEPKPGHDDRYFEIAARLRPVLDKNGGVAFIDRYRSLQRPGIILSYQHWQDEAHLLKWRNNVQHLGAQRAGREVHFEDYRIRVAHLLTPEMALPDHAERLVIAVDSTSDTPEVDSGETFASVYREGQYVSLYSVGAQAQAIEIMDANDGAADVTAIHVFSVFRDYTMHKREEAPQEWSAEA